MQEPSPIRYRVHFGGHVQGVGFRATCASIARRHRVAGTVRNLPDGRVELVIEGPEEEVHGVLAKISDAMGRHIQSVVKDVEPPHGLEGFQVVR